MTCEFRAIGIHVHGHEADIEAFFERVEAALESVAEVAPLLWPSLEILDADDSDLEEEH